MITFGKVNCWLCRQERETMIALTRIRAVLAKRRASQNKRLACCGREVVSVFGRYAGEIFSLHVRLQQIKSSDSSIIFSVYHGDN
jgi:septum formation topological specificity factor MinE